MGTSQQDSQQDMRIRSDHPMRPTSWQEKDIRNAARAYYYHTRAYQSGNITAVEYRRCCRALRQQFGNPLDWERAKFVALGQMNKQDNV